MWRCAASARALRLGGPGLLVALVALLSGSVWPASGDPQPPLPPNTTWQSRLQFWRFSEVNWSPPEDAVYARHRAPDSCHCRHICLADPECVAADLVMTTDGLSCRLTAKRGNSTADTTAVAAFVRLGSAKLGERCLTDDECWQGAVGAGCVDGVCTCPAPPLTARADCVISDCSELTALGVTASGQHWMRPAEGATPAAVFCDMVTDGGGWTVFQRRQDDEEQLDFYRDWQSYRDGFGNVSGQFWLGNELIHRLTAPRPHQLRIDMEDFDGNRRFAQYDTFRVADEADNYRLTVAGFSGNVNDSLSYHNGYPFSTKDRDNDVYATSCAQTYIGAWWYANCHTVNLNGRYMRGTYDKFAIGVCWEGWMGYQYSLKRTEMKSRPSLEDQLSH